MNWPPGALVGPAGIGGAGERARRLVRAPRRCYQQRPAMRRLAIYAHYDSQREVKRFTLHFLQCLAKLCERVDFVSTSPLPERELDKVRPLCARAFTKENTGFDFGMWQRALGDVDLAAWDELVITNSSVFGPLFPLEEMFERMAAARCDFWSATDNHDIDWHLQSY